MLYILGFPLNPLKRFQEEVLYEIFLEKLRQQELGSNKKESKEEGGSEEKHYKVSLTLSTGESRGKQVGVFVPVYVGNWLRAVVCVCVCVLREGKTVLTPKYWSYLYIYKQNGFLQSDRGKYTRSHKNSMLFYTKWYTISFYKLQNSASMNLTLCLGEVESMHLLLTPRQVFVIV